MSGRTRSWLNHFASGLVLAIVAVELLPDIEDSQPWAVAAGLAFGVVVMLLVRWFGQSLERRGGDGSRSSLPLLITVGIDLLIDGLLLGLAFSLGTEAGLLLTVALTIEVLSLGLTVATQLVSGGTGRTRAVWGSVALSALLTVGALLGVTVLQGLTGVPFVVSFGVAALLYLVVEELLVEAHEEPETTAGVVAFFLGFLVLLMLGAVA